MAGISHEEFWTLTLGEIADRLSAHYDAERQTERHLIAQAWYASAFDRQKVLPQLETILTPEAVNRRLYGEELERRLHEHEQLVTAMKLKEKPKRGPRWRRAR